MDESDKKKELRIIIMNVIIHNRRCTPFTTLYFSGVSRNSKGGGGGILKAIFLAFQFLGGVLLVTQQVDWQWCSGSGATGAYSILYDGATLWNTLDKNIVHAQSLIDFKRMLQTWGGVTCSCMVCKSCCLNNM